MNVWARSGCTGARQIATGLNALARRNGKVRVVVFWSIRFVSKCSVALGSCHVDVHRHRHGCCCRIYRRVMQVSLWLLSGVGQTTRRFAQVGRCCSRGHGTNWIGLSSHVFSNIVCTLTRVARACLRCTCWTWGEFQYAACTRQE